MSCPRISIHTSSLLCFSLNELLNFHSFSCFFFASSIYIEDVNVLEKYCKKTKIESTYLHYYSRNVHEEIYLTCINRNMVAEYRSEYMLSKCSGISTIHNRVVRTGKSHFYEFFIVEKTKKTKKQIL